MKRITLLFLSPAMLLMLFIINACDKNNNGQDEEILTERIENIIPAAYIDTLKSLGLTINSGTTPPQLTGTYLISPHKLEKSNIATDYKGMSFSDAKLTLFGQNNKNYSISMLGEHFLAARDTSILTAISGSGNNFTIYGKVKATNGNYYAITAILISGELEGTSIKNLKTGIINIDNTHGSPTFIAQGKGRVAFDSDFTSPRIDVTKQAIVFGNNPLELLSTQPKQ